MHTADLQKKDGNKPTSASDAERAVHAFVISYRFVWVLEGMVRDFHYFTSSFAPPSHDILHAQEPLQPSLQALNLGCITTDDPPASFGCLGQLQYTSVWQP